MEQVPVAEFLEELESRLIDNCLGGGHPSHYVPQMAFQEQVTEYVMRRMRVLLKGQKFVLLPDGEWTRADYEKYCDELETY